MNRLQQAWQQLSPRDRRILVAGSFIALALLCYALLWQPFQERMRGLQDSISNQRTTLADMQQAASEIRLYRDKQQPASTEGLLTLSDASAREHGLAAALQRVRPEGEQSVRIWLENAPFGALLGWLDELAYQHGVHIAGLHVELLAEQPGQVNARLTLDRAP